jgi:multidrug efflux system membrane fusion protein
VAFREGADVSRGQLLFQLDPRPFRTTYQQALATLARDRAQAESARLDAERAESLFARGVLSQAEWDQKRNAAAAGQATLRADSAAVSAARLNLDYTSIRAPISGRTGRLMVHEGDYIRNATAEPLVTINRIQPVRVRFTVPENAVAEVQRYRQSRPRVLIRNATGDSLEGPLVFVDNAVDPSSGTLLMKGEFANTDGRLVPGQYVDVRLVLHVEPRATVVPAPAVTTGQEGPYVYVLNADSTVTMRPVSIRRTVDELAVVASGLKPGEIVVTDGQIRLSPGARVVVRSGGAAERH